MSGVVRSIYSVALVVIVAACSSLLPSGLPAQFVNRPALPSCGAEVRAQRDGPDPVARSCLMSAFDEQRSAELVSTRPTVEGDPIVTYFRVWPTADIAVEVYTDSSRDKFGSAAWTYSACERLVPAAGDEVFEVAGCPDEPQVLVR